MDVEKLSINVSATGAATASKHLTSLAGALDKVKTASTGMGNAANSVEE